MNAVERVLEYEAFEEEKPAIVTGNRPPSVWPHIGEVTVSELWVRYREDLDPVLKDVSFGLAGGEKLGVCGRTGSGKSTLMMTIYRLVEPLSGSVVIDGVDITRIGLQDLRSRLSLVP